MASPRKRRIAARAAAPAPVGLPDWVLPVVGLGAVGVGVYLLWPRATPAAVLPPGRLPLGGGIQATPTTPVTLPGVPTSVTPVTPPPPPVPSPTPPGQASAALLARLRNSATARRVFAFQSLWYSYGLTDATPDGIEGPITDAMVRQVNQLGGFTTEPNTVTTRTIGNAAAVAPRAPGARTSLRLIPLALPADVLALLNTSLRAEAPTAPFVQANAV